MLFVGCLLVLGVDVDSDLFYFDVVQMQIVQWYYFEFVVLKVCGFDVVIVVMGDFDYVLVFLLCVKVEVYVCIFDVVLCLFLGVVFWIDG